MSSEKKYTNMSGQEISFQQANLLDFYVETTSTDTGELNNIYQNGILSGTSHSIYSSDSITTILASDPNAGIDLYSTVGSYKTCTILVYKNSILKTKVLTVNDSSNNCLCWQPYDLVKDAVNYLQTEKKYFDAEGNTVFTFTYNADGSCFSIAPGDVMESEILATLIGIDPDITFSWQGFEYYQFAYPLVPNH